jgi:hypothetical protein
MGGWNAYAALMGRARYRRSGRSGASLPVAAPGEEPAEVHPLARLSQLVGNRAVAQMLARAPSGAPPIKDRTRIDELAKKTVSAVERCRAYAEIAGTQSVQMDPTTVHVSAFYQDGVNLDALKQARNVPARTGWLDGANNFSGGAPPETVKGVAMVVNSNSARFEDEDYMVAAIRHEMVHVRLLRLTLKHLTDWKQAPGGLSFAQYVDRHVGGTDGALIKDRSFGGHMDETVAYVEGFLTAYSYSPIEEPQAGDRAWIGHLKGFTEEFETARLNSGPLPKNRTGVPESAIATRQSASAVVPEAEKVVKEYCDSAGEPRRKNLAAWMQRLYKSEGMHDAALKMIYKVATNGKTIPEPKR